MWPLALARAPPQLRPRPSWALWAWGLATRVLPKVPANRDVANQCPENQNPCNQDFANQGFANQGSFAAVQRSGERIVAWGDAAFGDMVLPLRNAWVKPLTGQTR